MTLSAGWAAVIISAIAGATALAHGLISKGREDGEMRQCIVQLTSIAADHEDRIRTLETPRRRRSGRRTNPT